MSQLTQFLSSGSSSSSELKGSIITTMPMASDALFGQGDAYYVKTGTRVQGLSTSMRNAINAVTDDFTLPVSYNVLAAAQAQSFKYGQSFVYGNSVYLRGTPNGVLRSTDGTSWTPVEITGAYPSNSQNQAVQPYTKIVFGAGLFMTVIDTIGSSASVQGAMVIATSTDGLTWILSSVASHFTTGEPLTGSAISLVEVGLDFDGTNFWLSSLVYSAGNATHHIMASKSANGKTWTPVYNMSSVGNGVSKMKVVLGNSNQMIVAPTPSSSNSQGNLAYGTTSASTSTVSPFTDEALNQVKFLNNLFVGFRSITNSTSALSTSPTGATWTTRTLPTAALIADFTFGNSIYVAVGDAGKIYTASDATSTWTARTSGTSEQLISVEWDATLSLFICVGVTTIRTSTDGITWSAATIPSGLGTRSSQIQAAGSCALLVKLNGTWFTTIGSSDHIISSANGTTWTASFIGGVLSTTSVVIGGSTAVNTTNALFKLNTLMVACPAAGGIMSAPLTTNTWSVSLVASTGIFNSVAYGAGLYVAVGNTGIIYTSPTGTTWTSRTSGTATNLTGIVWSGAEFIAISSTVAIRSTDGTTWSSAGSNGGSAICYSGGRFIVLASTNVLRTSPTGVDWISNTLSSVSGSYSQLRPISDGAVVFGSSANVWICTNSGLRALVTAFAVDSVTEINGSIYLYSSNASGYWIGTSPTYNIGSSTATSLQGITGDAPAGKHTSASSLSNNRSGIKTGSNTYAISQSATLIAGIYGMSTFTQETCRILASNTTVAFYNDADMWAASDAGLSWAPKAQVCSLCTSQAPWASNATATPTSLSNYGLPMLTYRKIS